jgi:gliding motility-associated transport system permease protein
MKPTLTIAERELKAYFLSPVGYFVIAGFLFLAGYLFYMPLAFTGDPSLRHWTYNIVIILIIMVPALTMRLIAEERRTGTVEVLATSPITDSQVVVGKFLGCLGFYAAMLALTFAYPIILTRVGKPEMGPIFTSYLGLFLFGASFVAIGLLASALTKSQVVGFVTAFVVLLFLFLVEWMAQTGSSGWLTTLVSYMGIQQHLENFSKGLIDTKDVIYYLSVVALCLLLSVRALQAWKWR